MEFITFAPEKPGQPACKWRIEEEPICYDPESYLLNAVAQDTPDFRLISLGTISRIKDRFSA
ncbi:hypothetical protein [Desulfosarcina widdelii]|uniref:hypothetical protein n=1 Tax=Desulfosarcina widdelii TaxID=947919 RepID=UPI0012D30A46|nr:hypothetical protein [Desulfosarcina widdelii]